MKIILAGLLLAFLVDPTNPDALVVFGIFGLFYLALGGGRR